MKTKLAKQIALAGLTLAATCAFTELQAATSVIYSNNFEGYAAVAATSADDGDYDPDGVEWTIADDTALLPTTVGAGVQVIGWLTNSAGEANQCLLLNPHSEARIYLRNAQSGSRYTVEFKAYINRGPTSSQSFLFNMQGMGADYNNPGDWIAYRTDRITNSHGLNLYDGTRPAPGWVTNTNYSHANGVWQQHRLVVDPSVPSITLYVDGTPVLTNGIARSETSVPTLVRLVNEANSPDDGFWAVDDLSIQVENAIVLTTPFKEGFEGYTARAELTDDADPAGPWVTTETDGSSANGGKPLNPGKVQIVDPAAEGLGFTAHSGSKCLKLEGAVRAGATLGWGVGTERDVKITWWARVPMSVKGLQAVYLRFSLYGAEGGNTYSGDAALMGYGSRDGTIGDETSLTYYTTAWKDTGVDYTPDTWEEYQIITHNDGNSYSLIKSPSSGSPITIVDHAPYIGTATSYGPMFMAAWSSSNGANHPPVYVDDITVASIPPEVIPEPYVPAINGSRFTNFTTLKVAGPAGAVAVDPRDNSTIVFTIDASPDGAIYKATKVASGNWAVDPTPVVSNLSNPSGLTVGPDGALWWVHDFATALMRLKAPWEANTPELIIADFGMLTSTNTWQDDDPYDLAFAPAGFGANAGKLIVMDRGVDSNPMNALIIVDPSTTLTNQEAYANYLLAPDSSALGAQDLVGMTVVAPDKVATLNLDGQVTLVDGMGIPMPFWPEFYLNYSIPIDPAGLAADPTTGRLWITDNLTNQVWSCDTSGYNAQRELSFPLLDPQWTSRAIDFHPPGMTFSPDGKFLVLTDSSIVNGGGRLIIFHSEAIGVPSFKINAIVRDGGQIKLAWQSAGGVKYNVLRGTSLTDAGSFVNISGDITTTSFTDTNSVTTPVFYKVVAK